VRLHRRAAPLGVVGVVGQRALQLGERLRLGSRRQALQLARACRFVRGAGGEVPIPDAVVGTCGGEGVALARGLELGEGRVDAAELAQHDREQQQRDRGERERSQARAERLRAPRPERGGAVAGDDDDERIVGDRVHRAEAVDAVDRAHRAQRRAPVGGGGEQVHELRKGLPSAASASG
jgi:hypothetical protein